MTLYGLLWAAGGNDILAVLFHLNLNYITYFMRVAIFVIPPFVFWLTRRWCISLQRADENLLLHGMESGIIMRSPEGGYSERHEPIPVDEAYTLMSRDVEEVYHAPPASDLNGVKGRNVKLMQLRAKASQYWFGSNIPKPTREELEEAHAHSAHELEGHDAEGRQVVPAGEYLGHHELEGHPADGHQFDGWGTGSGEDLGHH
jgi:ubiquinol-cytochrome c reductase cytochrome b subunit